MEPWPTVPPRCPRPPSAAHSTAPGPATASDELARVEYPVRIHRLLDGAQHAQTPLPEFGGQPRPVIGADGVMMGDGGTGGGDRVRSGPLGSLPLADRVPRAARRQHGEVQ